MVLANAHRLPVSGKLGIPQSDPGLEPPYSVDEGWVAAFSAGQLSALTAIRGGLHGKCYAGFT